ncbi:MAG: extracellular solute-binding protein [Oscillospiraceae bacterium]|jgi:arabinogalactan oligomer/maltooligosaccharide transport system substrate-binding protein|nr:extracellular solute-binding protein [Oscillospiraceae bacterium]
MQKQLTAFKQRLIFIFSLVAVLVLTSVFVLVGYQFIFPNTEPVPATQNNAALANDPFYGEDNMTLKVGVPNALKETITAQCAEFIKLHPNKSISINVIEYPDIVSTMLVGLGNLPDLMFFNSDKLHTLAENNLLLPVYALPNEITGVSKQSIISRNTKNSAAAAMYDNDLFAYPYAADNGYVLFYDKRILTTEDVASFESLIDASEQNGKTLIMDAGKSFYSSMFLFAGGFKTENYDIATGVQQFNNYDRSSVINALDAFNLLFANNPNTFKSHEVDAIITGFKNDSTAAGICGFWQVEQAKEALGANLGVAQIPTVKINQTNTKTSAYYGYTMLGIHSNTFWVEASQMLADYLTGEACQTRRAEQNGTPPTNIAAAKIANNNEIINAFLKQESTAVPLSGIKDPYFASTSELGYQISSSTPLGKADLGELFDDAINRVKSETANKVEQNGE